MNKNRINIWVQEFEFDSCDYNDSLGACACTNYMEDAHTVLNKFFQKEQKRNKAGKKRRQCWQ